MDSMGEDLARSLAAGAATTPEELEERGWPVEEQIDAVLDHLHVHMAGGSVQVATDREIYLVEELIECGYFPEWARDYFRRMPPEQQPERELWLFERREQHKLNRDAHQAWNEWAELHGRYPLPDHIAKMFSWAEG